MATGTEMTLKGAGISRQEFGALEVRQVNETAAAAVAKQAEAETNARYIMAMRNPRDIEEFRDRLLKECSRPYFVNDSLQSGTLLKYALPRGKEKNPQSGAWEPKFVEGPTIRFVEVALRCFRNVLTQTPVVYESDDARIVNVTVTDLESNIAYSQAVVVHKTVERSGFKNGNTWEAPRGKTVISERMNSKGEPTYLVEATEEEVFAKQNSLISKTVRTLALRLLPGDIVDEAMATGENMIGKKDAEDPDGAKRKIIDEYAKLGVGAKDLAALLDHSLDIVSGPELKMLRKVYVGLANGEATWHQILQASEGQEGGSTEAAKNGMADKLKTMQSDQKAAKPATQAAEQKTASTNEPRDNSQDDPGPSEGLFDAQQSRGSNTKPGGFGSRKN